MVPKQKPMNLKICVPSETSGYCSDRRYTYKELPKLWSEGPSLTPPPIQNRT
jgi:hypothetical protein